MVSDRRRADVSYDQLFCRRQRQGQSHHMLKTIPQLRLIIRHQLFDRSACFGCLLKMQKTGSRAFHSSSTRSLVASPRQTSYPSRLSQAIRPNNNQKRLYSNAISNTVIPPPRPSRLPRTLILIGALSASTVIAWYTSETFRHSTIAILRCGRVGVVAAQCILDYSTVMRKKYSSSEEENQAMSDCHKRSAKTTYNAMRRNGGIYIKL